MEEGEADVAAIPEDENSKEGLMRKLVRAEASIAELQAKYESQSSSLSQVTKEKGELEVKLRTLKAQRMENGGKDDITEDLRLQLGDATAEIDMLQSKLAELEDALALSEDKVDKLQSLQKLEVKPEEAENKNNGNNESNEEKSEKKEENGQGDQVETADESKDGDEPKEEKTVAMLEKELINYKLLHQDLAEQRDAMNEELEDANERNSRHKQKMLEQVRKEAILQQQAQGQLQEVRTFLEELKLEYQQFGDSTRVEKENMLKQHQRHEQMMKADFEKKEARYQRAMESNYANHMEIVKTLQDQFQQYREVAENLFLQEASKLETTLADHTRKHEGELQYIIKLNERRFGAMVTAKDAKIMNLIEGTDFQKLLVRQEMEVNQLNMRHAQDLRLVKEKAETEAQAQVYQLNKEISRKNMEIEKYQNQVQTWESKQRELMQLLKKQKRQTQLEAESARKDAELVQEQLDEAYKKIQGLVQQKETLRHVVLRLRLQLEGKADDSVDSMVDRLSKEAKTMKVDLDKLTSHIQLESQKNETLSHQAKKAAKIRADLEKELSSRATEYDRLTSTFERYLKKKMSSVFGMDRVALDAPKFTKAHSNLLDPRQAPPSRTEINALTGRDFLGTAKDGRDIRDMQRDTQSPNIGPSYLAQLSESRMDRYLENGSAGSQGMHLTDVRSPNSRSFSRSLTGSPSNGHMPRPPDDKGSRKLTRSEIVIERELTNFNRNESSDGRPGGISANSTKGNKMDKKRAAKTQFKQPKISVNKLVGERDLKYLTEGFDKLAEFRKISTKFNDDAKGRRRRQNYMNQLDQNHLGPHYLKTPSVAGSTSTSRSGSAKSRR